MDALYLSALVLGLAGSLHCVGMCGPIALSLPFASAKGWGRGMGILTYFGGKTFTYSALGALFGIVGEQLVLAGWQQALSLVLGIAMLFFAIVTIFKPAVFHSNPLTIYLGNKLSPLMGAMMGKRAYSATFVLGMLNGLLPCGLVYVALSAAVATGSVVSAATFMTVFGIATAPLMLFLLLFAAQLSSKYRSKMRQWLPVFTGIVAILLILRGLDLGIPYVSPHLDGLPTATRAAETISCHE